MGARDAGNADGTLLEWMEREMRFASEAILEGVSATNRTMRRKTFGQTILPKPGSIVAAPATDLSAGDPDYFFHWIRDSALVMDSLRIPHQRGAFPNAARIFDDFVAFSRNLNRLDGPALLRHADIRQPVDPNSLQYVRSDDDLMGATGDALPGEVRFNPDGTLDIIRWSRPQNDGPALRVLCLLRWRQSGSAFGAVAVELATQDLAFTERRRTEPCYDLWEEELGHHYYTRLVQMAALDDGAEWVAALGNTEWAGRLRSAAGNLRASLDLHWSPERRCYLSRAEAYRDNPRKDLDSSVILAVLHADRSGGDAHSVLDPKVQSTLAKLEDLFAEEYRINTSLRDGRGPAMGRYAGDRYVSGGAWYMTTLAAAEFHYRIAASLAQDWELRCTDANAAFLARVLGHRLSSGEKQPFSPQQRTPLVNAFVRRGDAFMATVRAYTPASGELSEQFDQSTGRPASARNLAWSYAAFITACDARQRAIAAGS